MCSVCQIGNDVQFRVTRIEYKRNDTSAASLPLSTVHASVSDMYGEIDQASRAGVPRYVMRELEGMLDNPVNLSSSTIASNGSGADGATTLLNKAVKPVESVRNLLDDGKKHVRFSMAVCNDGTAYPLGPSMYQRQLEAVSVHK